MIGTRPVCPSERISKRENARQGEKGTGWSFLLDLGQRWQYLARNPLEHGLLLGARLIDQKLVHPRFLVAPDHVVKSTERRPRIGWQHRRPRVQRSDDGAWAALDALALGVEERVPLAHLFDRPE